MSSREAFPELYALSLQFAEYPYKGLLFKDVEVSLHKPHAIETIARNYFTQEEVTEVEAWLSRRNDTNVSLHKTPIRWPVSADIGPVDFGGYGASSLDLDVTDTVKGYAYSIYDFETIDGKRFDPTIMDTFFVTRGGQN